MEGRSRPEKDAPSDGVIILEGFARSVPEALEAVSSIIRTASWMVPIPEEKSKDDARGNVWAFLRAVSETVTFFAEEPVHPWSTTSPDSDTPIRLTGTTRMSIVWVAESIPQRELHNPVAKHRMTVAVRTSPPLPRSCCRCWLKRIVDKY